MSKRRRDIDGLRAVAVLAVIVEHLNKRWLPGGFTGVDVFLVISGFVITTSLLTHQTNSVIDYVRSFYSRRIRRILPALVTCIVITTALTALFIAPTETKELYYLAVTAFLGISNIQLIHTGQDYFALGQEFNPYIHTWSLGVEEQFYLIFPFLLLLALKLKPFNQNKTPHKKAIITTLLLSIALSILCILLPRPNIVNHYAFNKLWSFLPLIPFVPAMITLLWIMNPEKRKALQPMIILFVTLSVSLAYSTIYSAEDSIRAYYSMPSRFWELATGAILAIATNAGFGKLKAHTRNCLSFLAVMLLGAGFILICGEGRRGGGYGFPIPLALIPVVATSLLIIVGGYPRPSVISKILSNKTMVGIGRISYSLYLWHWPIMVIMRWTIGLNSAGKILIYVILTGIVSILSYWFIEQPFQKSRSLGTVLVPTMVTAFCALMLYANINNPIFQKTYAFPDLMRKIPKNYLREMNCHHNVDNFDACFTPMRSASKPYAIFVIGDSHAAHFIPMLKEIEKNSDFEIIQGTDGLDSELADANDPLMKLANERLTRILHLFEYNLKPNDIVLSSIMHGHIYNSYPLIIEYELLLNGNKVNIYAKSLLSQR